MSLVLYSKPGCHLCEDVRADLVRLAVPFDERDITSDAELLRRFRYLIPVLEAADGRVLEAPITSEALAAFVKA